MVLYIPGGAGFLPSAVIPAHQGVMASDKIMTTKMITPPKLNTKMDKNTLLKMYLLFKPWFFSHVSLLEGTHIIQSSWATEWKPPFEVDSGRS